MKNIISLALNFKALGGMASLETEALEVYEELVEAVEQHEDHTEALKTAQSITSFDY